MGGFWGVAFSIFALLISGALVFTRRYRLSSKTALGFSELFLFLTTAVSISVINSFGFIAQYYLSNLMKWHSYNVHDILLGNTLSRVDDLNMIVSAQPLPAICCAIALLLAHRFKKPLTFFVVFSVAFFLSMSSVDGLVALIYSNRPLPPLWESLLADFVGSPILGLVGTCLHFYMAKSVDALKPMQRYLALPFLGVFAISIFASGFFLLERLFLVTSPTYFEAVVGGNDTKISAIMAPPLDAQTGRLKLDSSFDPIVAPHPISNHFSLYADDIKLRWIPPNRGGAGVAAFSVYDCSSDRLEEVVRYFKAETSQFMDGIPFGLEVIDAPASIVVPATKWRGFLFSAERDLDEKHSFWTEVLYDKKKQNVSLSDFVSEYKRLSFRPNTDTLAFGVAAGPTAKTPLRLRIGASTINRNLISPRKTTGRCMARVIRDGRVENFQGQPPSALIVLIRNQNSSGVDQASRSGLELTAKDGLFDVGPIAFSDPYAENDAPYAQGDLRFFAAAHVSLKNVRLYGSPVDTAAATTALIWGDSISARLNHDGTISLHGTLDGLDTGSERYMKTQWELFDSPIKIFTITSFFALLGLFLRYLVSLLLKNDDGMWHYWTS